MKIASLGGNRAHAPANSRLSLISAYTGGADILRLTVRLCQSKRLVLAEDDDTMGPTGKPGSVREMSVTQLRQLDFSTGFVARGHTPGEFFFLDHRVPNRRFLVDMLDEVLDELPEDTTLWFDLGGLDGDPATFTDGADALATLIEGRARTTRCLLSCGNDAGYARLRQKLPMARFVVLYRGLNTQAADFVMFEIHERDATPALQAELSAISQQTNGEKWPSGAILACEGAVSADLVRAVAASGAVSVLAVESTFDTQKERRSYVKVHETFAGVVPNRLQFSLGYAKANTFATVSWNEGVHIDIAPYDGPLPVFSGTPLERTVERLKWDVINAAREWPFYSGGGVGLRSGLSGDFAAEVDYRVKAVGQATTLEMAVVNADPGSTRDSPPTSFRDKNSFFDPHGAPPFVGVEHDEDDGFRINWNLGTEYDNNQYGRPVGDGVGPRGARLRLERRGAWFAAYYRQPVDGEGAYLAPIDWICVGVTRNESLNRTVYLRCVGKRWRQEKVSDPTQYEAILANSFTFSNLKVVCFPAAEGV